MHGGHKETVDRYAFITDRQLISHDRLLQRVHLNAFGIVIPGPHINTDLKRIQRHPCHMLDPRQCFHIIFLCGFNSLIITVFRKAANSVSTHRCAGSVRIVEYHLQRLLLYQNTAVCTDSRMPVTDMFDKIFNILML